jgi:hypothetical protein
MGGQGWLHEIHAAGGPVDALSEVEKTIDGLDARKEKLPA